MQHLLRRLGHLERHLERRVVLQDGHRLLSTSAPASGFSSM
jgi:hypothetical protein